MIRHLVLLALVAPVFADEPPEQLVDELAELREQVGGGVVADRADFADALRRIAGNEGRAAVADGAAGGGPMPREGRPSPHGPERYHQPPHHASARDDAEPGGRDPYRFGPRMGRSGSPPSIRLVGPPPPAPPRPAKVMLREMAFELDRLAHELEMAELCDEADELRESANRLRKSARKSTDRPDGAKEAKRQPKGPSSGSRQAERERDFRRRVAETRKRFAEQKRRIEEEKHALEAKHESEEREARAGERTTRPKQKKRPKRQKRIDRRQRDRSKPAEPSDVVPSGDADAPDVVLEELPDSPVLPPKGVHGGPTEPLKPHDE